VRGKKYEVKKNHPTRTAPATAVAEGPGFRARPCGARRASATRADAVAVPKATRRDRRSTGASLRATCAAGPGVVAQAWRQGRSEGMDARLN